MPSRRIRSAWLVGGTLLCVGLAGVLLVLNLPSRLGPRASGDIALERDDKSLIAGSDPSAGADRRPAGIDVEDAGSAHGAGVLGERHPAEASVPINDAPYEDHASGGASPNAAHDDDANAEDHDRITNELGDAGLGKTLYGVHKCAACHGPEGRGGFGAKIRGQSATAILERLNGTRVHPGGQVRDITLRDAKHLAAFLAE